MTLDFINKNCLHCEHRFEIEKGEAKHHCWLIFYEIDDSYIPSIEETDHCPKCITHPF